MSIESSSRSDGSESATVWFMLHVDPLGPDFAYVQVADAIAGLISTGEIGGRLPDCRCLAEEFGVAYQTVRHSLQVLRDRGLIVSRPGRGTFVAPPALAARPAGKSEPALCELGGLAALPHLEPTAASAHMARSRACQLEFISRGGLLPPPGSDH